MQLSGLLQRPSCIGKCIGTLVFLHLQDGRDDGLHFPSDEGQNGPVELPPHLSSFINVLPLVDWRKICARWVQLFGCHVQLLRSRFDVFLLLFGSMWTIREKVVVVEEIFNHDANGTILFCINHGNQCIKVGP